MVNSAKDGTILTRRAWLSIAGSFGAVAALVGLGRPRAAGAQQHGGHGAQEAGQGHHEVAFACQEQFEAAVREGHGFGMSFVADRNGYLGPRHILELKAQLALSPEQEAKAAELMQAMLAESRPKGERLLEAERRLERLFADRAAGEASLRAAVAEVERARGELRLVHLLTHLRARDLLTQAQRGIYHSIRWRGI